MAAFNGRSIFGVLLLFAGLTASLSARQKLTLDEVMRRAHAYVAVYEDHQLSSLIAREEYKQQWLRHDLRDPEAALLSDERKVFAEERTLLSEYMIFQLPPSEDWFGLRDVREVDGVPVADHDVRLKLLFTDSRTPHRAAGDGRRPGKRAIQSRRRAAGPSTCRRSRCVSCGHQTASDSTSRRRLKNASVMR